MNTMILDVYNSWCLDKPLITHCHTIIFEETKEKQHIGKNNRMLRTIYLVIRRGV